MIEIPELVALGKEFAQLHHEPLLVTAHMAGEVCNYEPIQFDGLLAKALIYSCGWRSLPDSEDPYWLPLPLKALWWSEDGLPLWAASAMFPVGRAVDGTHYIHKRNPSYHGTTAQKLTTRNGRYMDRRIPVPALATRVLQARVIGNKELVEALLRHLPPHVGKHRTRGMGAILNWDVTPASFNERETYEQDGALVKAIPQYSVYDKHIAPPIPVGWTPPHWKPSLWTPGYRIGTRIDSADAGSYWDDEFFSGIDELMGVSSG